MRRTATAMYRMAAAIVVGAAAPPALCSAADPSPASAATATPPLVGGVDFISPAGEPFHSADALSGAEHWFRQADADRDGRLTLAEFQADGLRFFKLLDVDHDSEIDSVEIERYETQVAPEISVLSTGDGPVTGEDGNPVATPYPDRLGAGRYGYIDLPEPIASMDANFDRGISIRELEQALARRFAALDTDADGAIAREELPKLKAADDADGHKHKRHGRSGR